MSMQCVKDNFFSSPTIIFAGVQNAHPNDIITACRELRVPRMSVDGVGDVVFMKVRAELKLFLH
jgi:hypothetical protein